jgi:predicted Rossmann fold nucleotide-binding protein DprA/Smf involved in DNA uptake
MSKSICKTDNNLQIINNNKGLQMTRFSPFRIQQGKSNYPSSVTKYLTMDAPRIITAIGNLDILQNKSLAVFCSNKCPGNIILKTYDLMRQVRERGITVISGFHSAIERECLHILLKGRQPVIICPARSIEGMRIKKDFRKPLEDGRLLIVSPFTGKDRRISSERALTRNYFVAALAETIFIPYAAPKSKTEMFCHELLKWKKHVYTIDDEKNMHLIKQGIPAIANMASLPNLFDEA